MESYLEELVVRRELADNFCHYAPSNYDSLECAAQWAKDSLALHLNDRTEYNYTWRACVRGAGAPTPGGWVGVCVCVHGGEGRGGGK